MDKPEKANKVHPQGAPLNFEQRREKQQLLRAAYESVAYIRRHSDISDILETCGNPMRPSARAGAKRPETLWIDRFFDSSEVSFLFDSSLIKKICLHNQKAILDKSFYLHVYRHADGISIERTEMHLNVPAYFQHICIIYTSYIHHVYIIYTSYIHHTHIWCRVAASQAPPPPHGMPPPPQATPLVPANSHTSSA